MHVTRDMMHPDLRFCGELIRKLLPYFKTSTFEKSNKALKLMKGHAGPGIRYEQRYIPRDPSGGVAVGAGASGAPDVPGAPGVPGAPDAYDVSGASNIPCTLASPAAAAPRPSADSLRICVYAPRDFAPADGPVPGVLWIHGGGYCLGAPEQDESFARLLMRTRPCVVVMPDYRLATEAPYPAALEDCHAALVWMRDHADELGIRPDQLMVGGDSAGGGLTAALCILERDKLRGESLGGAGSAGTGSAGTSASDGVRIAFQMPLYPMIDDRMNRPSAVDNDAPVWNSKSNECGWRMYLGDLFGTDDVPPTVAPSRLEDCSDLPPLLTFVGDIEPFHDETVDYVARLEAAGVPTQCRVYQGCWHAFDILASRSEPGKDARRFLADGFSRAVDAGDAGDAGVAGGARGARGAGRVDPAEAHP